MNKGAGIRVVWIVISSWIVLAGFGALSGLNVSSGSNGVFFSWLSPTAAFAIESAPVPAPLALPVDGAISFSHAPAVSSSRSSMAALTLDITTDKIEYTIFERVLIEAYTDGTESSVSGQILYGDNPIADLEFTSEGVGVYKTWWDIPYNAANGEYWVSVTAYEGGVVRRDDLARAADLNYQIMFLVSRKVEPFPCATPMMETYQSDFLLGVELYRVQIVSPDPDGSDDGALMFEMPEKKVAGSSQDSDAPSGGNGNIGFYTSREYDFSRPMIVTGIAAVADCPPTASLSIEVRTLRNSEDLWTDWILVEEGMEQLPAAQFFQFRLRFVVDELWRSPVVHKVLFCPVEGPPPTESPVLTETPTPTPSDTPTPEAPTETPTESPTPEAETPTLTPSTTLTPSETVTPSLTFEGTDIPTITPTSPGETPTEFPSPSPPSESPLASPSPSISLTPSPSDTPSPSPSISPSTSPTASPSESPSPSLTPSPTASPSESPSPSISPSLSPTEEPPTTPTLTPTVSPSPTSTLTPSPSPSPTHFRTSYDFTSDDADGWVYKYALPLTVPTSATLSQPPGFLRIQATDNKKNFGYWESPEFVMVESQEEAQSLSSDVVPIVRQMIEGTTETMFLVRWKVFSDWRLPCPVPQMRLRATGGDFQQSDLLVVFSSQCGDFSPTSMGDDYVLLFQANPSQTRFKFQFDMLNFDYRDSPKGILDLDRVEMSILDSSELPSLTTEQLITFTSGTEGWAQMYTNDFDAPVFGYDSNNNGALTLSSGRSANVFGFWYTSQPVLTIDGAKSYYARFRVRSSLPGANRDQVPSFRCRINETVFQGCAYTHLTSKGTADRMPSRTQPVDYLVCFQPGDFMTGRGLLLAFDLLSLDPNDDLSSLLYLDEVEVYSSPKRY